jgi:hypothetical protein
LSITLTIRALKNRIKAAVFENFLDASRTLLWLTESCKHCNDGVNAPVKLASGAFNLALSLFQPLRHKLTVVCGYMFGSFKLRGFDMP